MNWANSLNKEMNEDRRIRYDTIEEFNVDSKAECDQLNQAHVARKNKKEAETNKLWKRQGTVIRKRNRVAYLLSFEHNSRT